MATVTIGGRRLVLDEDETPQTRPQQASSRTVEIGGRRLILNEPSATSSVPGAFGRGALESAAPSAVGLGAAAALLPAATAAAPATFGASYLLPAVAVLATAFGASKLQDVALKKLFPEQREAFLRQRAEDIEQHPIASTAGEFLPALLTLKPRIPTTVSALKIGAASGGVQAGLEAGAELATEGKLHPGRIATSGVLGGLLTKPTRLGKKLFPTPAEVTPGPASAEPLPTRVQKIMTALEEAAPARGEQEVLATVERGKRLVRLLGIRKELGGEAGFRAELSQLKGELPKVQFESIRQRLNQLDIDGLFDDENSSRIDSWDQVTARAGLAKLLQTEGGQVPTQGELNFLGQVFGPQFVKAILQKRPLLEQWTRQGIRVLNTPRAIMASMDLSAPLRQGLFLIGNPKQWIPAFTSMFKQFASESAFNTIQESIRSRPTYPLMKQARLSLTDIGESFTHREEAFMSSFADNIPSVHASNRGYVGFLNKLRADTFDDLVKKGQQLGVAEDPGFARSVAKYVNSATGRGELGRLEPIAVALNTVFFSPRLLTSRLRLLNPLFYASLHPVVRQRALTDALTMVSAGLSILGLAKLSRVEIGVDPRSSDFGKLKVGNTRYDIWGGFQ